MGRSGYGKSWDGKLTFDPTESKKHSDSIKFFI